ncbi:MAG TPA: hypothetical protein VM942_07710, partial [Acidimicrobiales bacterium]|nr:hypothetical protein [Acidimicrobiales bacterium]
MQRLAGNRAVTCLMVQRDLTDLMKEGLAERRGRAMGMSPADTDKEFFATERFVSSGGSRATLEASALPPAKPEFPALEPTLATQSRVGPLATDAPAL